MPQRRPREVWITELPKSEGGLAAWIIEESPEMAAQEEKVLRGIAKGVFTRSKKVLKDLITKGLGEEVSEVRRAMNKAFVKLDRPRRDS